MVNKYHKSPKTEMEHIDRYVNKYRTSEQLEGAKKKRVRKSIKDAAKKATPAQRKKMIKILKERKNTREMKKHLKRNKPQQNRGSNYA